MTNCIYRGRRFKGHKSIKVCESFNPIHGEHQTETLRKLSDQPDSPSRRIGRGKLGIQKHNKPSDMPLPRLLNNSISVTLATGAQHIRQEICGHIKVHSGRISVKWERLRDQQEAGQRGLAGRPSVSAVLRGSSSSGFPLLIESTPSVTPQAYV